MDTNYSTNSVDVLKILFQTNRIKKEQFKADTKRTFFLLLFKMHLTLHPTKCCTIRSLFKRGIQDSEDLPAN